MARRKVMKMPTRTIERDLRKQGFEFIAGIDEAGRGPWAGPVFAAAVILPLHDGDALVRLSRENVRDGKLISSGRREKLYDVVRELAIAVGVGQASVRDIDNKGIVPATFLAMERALKNLKKEHEPDYLLIDYHELPQNGIPQLGIPKGEWHSRNIAAASIIAKVARDRHMLKVDEKYPQYGFARHKGYGTAQHRKALLKHGLCGEHRTSFRPMSTMLD